MYDNMNIENTTNKFLKEMFYMYNNNNSTKEDKFIFHEKQVYFNEESGKREERTVYINKKGEKIVFKQTIATGSNGSPQQWVATH